MNRRNFLKGFFCTAAIVATGSLARAAEDVMGHVEKTAPKFDPVTYRGEWKWLNVADANPPRYDFVDGEWRRIEHPALPDKGFFYERFESDYRPANPTGYAIMYRKETFWEKITRYLHI